MMRLHVTHPFPKSPTLTRTGVLLGLLVPLAGGCSEDSAATPTGAPNPAAPPSVASPGDTSAVQSPVTTAPTPVAGAAGSTQPPVSTTGSNAQGFDEFGNADTGAPSASPPVVGDPTPAPAGEAGDDMWCNSRTILQSDCQSCHGTELVGGAPMPLVTWEDTQAPAVSDPNKKVFQLIGTRIHEENRPMPPLSQAPLAPESIGVLDKWVAAGAPNSAQACPESAAPPPTTEKEFEWPEECEEFYEIRAQDNGQPHIVPANTEQELDFNIPVPWTATGPVQALAIKPIANNKRVVHHWILYAGSFDFITSWSPGKEAEVFPDGVGVHMPSSGTFRLDMHYYNVGNDQAEADESGLEVCITRNPRPNTATTYMFAGDATVPPAQRTTNETVCDVTTTEPVHLITSSPHMHSYGVYAKLEVLRPDGSVEVLEDGPFNWEDQHITPIDTVIQTGDRVRVTCVYENNTERLVSFGLSSTDEMCFNFARYYPMDALSCGGLGALGGLAGGLGGGGGGLGGFGF